MTRHLVIVLGDQLDLDASSFDGFDPVRDAVWMAEVEEESTHVWSSKSRTALFLAAMRHFANALSAMGRTVHYTRLDAPDNSGSLASELAGAITRLKPERLVMTAPGDHRVLSSLRGVATAFGLELQIREDRHFFGTVREFAAHSRARSQLRLEYFYRDMRKRYDVLMDGSEPCGGRWNYDINNRAPFTRKGPGDAPPPLRFEPDAMTGEVLTLVSRRFPTHPGGLDAFAWPVTVADAQQALAHFIEYRLPSFGRWQDAMWPDEPWLWHSQLSAALNLKLLKPREVVAAAENSWRDGRVPLESAEGFIRQILGWREYVRGVYWTQMPGYLGLNAFDAHLPLPDFYWNGDTSMACLADAIRQTLRYGYAHHIQRLMITGLYALLLGVHPPAIHRWYLAVYVDAVEWVELPNTLGMSQAADGGLMGSKPYIASGRYIEKMSAGSLCARCRFKPGERTGDRACPFTTLYWDFLVRHELRLSANPRMAMQLKNLKHVDAVERKQIAEGATAIRTGNADA